MGRAEVFAGSQAEYIASPSRSLETSHSIEARWTMEHNPWCHRRLLHRNNNCMVLYPSRTRWAPHSSRKESAKGNHCESRQYCFQISCYFIYSASMQKGGALRRDAILINPQHRAWRERNRDWHYVVLENRTVPCQ